MVHDWRKRWILETILVFELLGKGVLVCGMLFEMSLEDIEAGKCASNIRLFFRLAVSGSRNLGAHIASLWEACALSERGGGFHSS